MREELFDETSELRPHEMAVRQTVIKWLESELRAHQTSVSSSCVVIFLAKSLSHDPRCPLKCALVDQLDLPNQD